MRTPVLKFYTKRGLLSERYDYKRLKKDARFLSLLVLNNEFTRIGSLNLIICSDSEIRKLNNMYMNHDYETDIITFRYDETENSDCEIFISADTIESNSSVYKCSFEEEMRRVIIHGILHLCGFDDKTLSQKKQMRRKENFYLKLFVTLKRTKK